jgi:hypothetical protein
MSADAAQPNGANDDLKVIALRRSGKSYASIAREMNFPRPSEATTAFFAAVRRSPPDERTVLQDEEMGRLQRLEDRVRANAELEPVDRDRRLEIVGRMRDRLLAP